MGGVGATLDENLTRVLWRNHMWVWYWCGDATGVVWLEV